MKFLYTGLFIASLMLTTNIMAQQKIKQTAGRDQLGDFAPEFARLNDDILFGEVWSRNDRLSLRDRSVVTITSLISQGITDSSLKYHLQTAKANGVTRTEIAEIITHAAFYAGWPKAWAAFRQAKENLSQVTFLELLRIILFYQLLLHHKLLLKYLQHGFLSSQHILNIHCI